MSVLERDEVQADMPRRDLALIVACWLIAAGCIIDLLVGWPI